MLKDNIKESKFKGDGVIWTVFLFLCLISIIEVFSASSNLSFKTGNYLGPVLKHCALLAVGVVVMICTMNIKCRYFKLVTPFALFISFILLIVVFFVGESTNGSQRWIEFLGIQFQPSELAKGAVILATAQILSAMQTPEGTDRRAFKYIMFVTIPMVLLIMRENLSTAVLLSAVVFLMMFIGKVPGQQLGRLLGIVLVGVAFIVTMVMVFGDDKKTDGGEAAGKEMVEQSAPREESALEKVFHRFDTWKVRIDNFLSNEYVAPEDVDINGSEASIPQTFLGFDMGYGEFITGNVYPTYASDKNAYPLGKATSDDEGNLLSIVFGPNSLFGCMLDDGRIYPLANPTGFFFSVEEYEKYLQENVEE